MEMTKNSLGSNENLDPFKEENSRIYFLRNPDFEQDAAWLRKKLKNNGGNIYFSSGEANYHVYSQLEDEFRIASDINKANIYFLAGPLISIPEKSAPEKTQEGREYLNPIFRLSKENKLKLFSSYKRQAYHYRVFENESITNILEPHHLGIKSTGAWYFYYSKTEAEAWKSRFIGALNSGNPIIENFLNHFVFITDPERDELKKWAAKNKIDVNKISLEECRKFWKENIGQ